MKKLTAILLLILVFTYSEAQNVGIGELVPDAFKLHVKTSDSALMVLHNAATSGTAIKNGLFFKTGNFYTGSIATIGTNGNHRLGLFTYGSNSVSGLLERFSIMDNGSVGINTIAPLAKFHVKSTDSSLVNLENSTALAGNVKSSLFLKTGNFYTGAIKTIGTSTNAARLGFFTFSSGDPNDLVEGISLTDNGNVGIGNTAPFYKLQVAGTLNATGILSNSFVNAATINSSGTAGVAGLLTANAANVTTNLQVDGNTRTGSLRVTAGAATNKILAAVNANGDAAWVNSSRNSGFSTQCLYSTTPTNGNDFLVPFKVVYGERGFNDEGAFNDNLSAYVVPVTGVYHFDVHLRITGSQPLIQSEYANIYGTLNIDGEPLRVFLDNYAQYQQVDRSFDFSYTVKLTAGEKVTVEFAHSINGVGIPVNNISITGQSVFSGYRVY